MLELKSNILRNVTTHYSEKKQGFEVKPFNQLVTRQLSSGAALLAVT